MRALVWVGAAAPLCAAARPAEAAMARDRIAIFSRRKPVIPYDPE